MLGDSTIEHPTECRAINIPGMHTEADIFFA